MARRKQRPVEEQEDPEMNISSMIDACFLLLIYFLVATSLVQEKKLDMAIPGSSAASGTPPPIEPGRIRVEGSGAVFWMGSGNNLPVGDALTILDRQGVPKPTDSNYKTYTNERNLDALVEQLKELKSQAQSAGQEPVVQIIADGDVCHQRIVDVMGALALADIHTVGLQCPEK